MSESQLGDLLDLDGQAVYFVVIPASIQNYSACFLDRLLSMEPLNVYAAATRIEPSL